MTNYEKIRSMTVEELAKFIRCQNPRDIDECAKISCYDCGLKWLKEEAEQTMPETKKQKTMMEDFFERCPEARRDEYGNPCACVENIYNNVVHYEKCATSFFGGIACRDCWSRPVTSRRECYKNATVIVEYDKNGDPIISWVRQEDTVRIGYEGAMKRVMKVKANENE